MEDFFANPYRGDPGIPHTDPNKFVKTWFGSFAFSAITCFNPYVWQLSNKFNWQDKAMLFEQQQWKKVLQKKQPFNFKWSGDGRRHHGGRQGGGGNNFVGVNQRTDKGTRDS